jgi:hypothetical protein
MSYRREQGIVIESRGLRGNSFLSYEEWDNFFSNLSHNPSVFFNQQGGVSFHGYGNMLYYGDEQSGNVLEYTALFSGKKSTATCVTRIKGKEIPLTVFLEFPMLLKAFLNSTIIFERLSQNTFDDKKKVYAIEGVTIPEHYQKYEQYFPLVCYNGFAALPKIIRKVIIARYKEQSTVHIKQKKRGIGCFG